MSKPNIISSFFSFLTGLVLIAFGIGSVAYLLLPHALKSYAEHAYNVHIEDVSIHTSGIELKNLTDHQQIIAIRSMKLTYNLRELIAGKIDSLTIDGLAIQPIIDPETPIIIPDIMAELDHLPISIHQIQINDLKVTVPTNEVIPEAVSITGTLQGVISEKGHQATLSSIIQPTEHSLGGHLNFNLQDSKLTMDLSINEIRLRDIPSAYNLKAKLTQSQGQPAAFEGSLTDNNHDVFLEAQGELTSPTTGSLTFDIPSITFDTHKFPLAELGNETLNRISDYSLTIAGQGSMSWDPTGIKPKGTFELKNANFLIESIKIEGLRFAIPIEQLWPKLNIQQGVHIASVKSPIMDITDLSMKFALEDNKFILQKAAGQVWGGTAQLSTYVISPLPAQQDILLTIEQADLEPLIAHLELEKVRANGLINGRIPMRLFGDNSVAIEDGKLESAENGLVSYQWDSALQSDDPNLKLTAKALQNFTYDNATLHIQKKRHDEPHLILDIKGKNPKLLEGREFDIHVNITGKILQALEATVRTFQADIKELQKEAKK
jgi:hypothetical protein